MDVRQFLLDAPMTCFLTCYDLSLHTKEDGSVHHLEDYNEISEVADITNGNCFIEMNAGKHNIFCSLFSWKILDKEELIFFFLILNNFHRKGINFGICFLT